LGNERRGCLSYRLHHERLGHRLTRALHRPRGVEAHDDRPACGRRDSRRQEAAAAEAACGLLHPAVQLVRGQVALRQLCQQEPPRPPAQAPPRQGMRRTGRRQWREARVARASGSQRTARAASSTSPGMRTGRRQWREARVARASGSQRTARRRRGGCVPAATARPAAGAPGHPSASAPPPPWGSGMSEPPRRCKSCES
jgi:hypothetical protein